MLLYMSIYAFLNDDGYTNAVNEIIVRDAG